MAFFLVMPGAISGAGFHGREDMNQTGMIAPFSDDGLLLDDSAQKGGCQACAY